MGLEFSLVRLNHCSLWRHLASQHGLGPFIVLFSPCLCSLIPLSSDLSQVMGFHAQLHLSPSLLPTLGMQEVIRVNHFKPMNSLAPENTPEILAKSYKVLAGQENEEGEE